MSFIRDAKTIFNLVASPIKGDTHAERLESFYQLQAKDYDSFRRKLLQGRVEVLKRVFSESLAEKTFVDFGCGTGFSIDFLGSRAGQLRKIYLVDLSHSLLKVAQSKCQELGLTNVEFVQKDVCQFRPDMPVDFVNFSYSLTMIPSWFEAVINAKKILRQGGKISVVDFYVSPKFAGTGRVQHNWFVRTFWSLWFASDNVFLSSDHLPFLENRFQMLWLNECRAKVPYLPVSKVPYYQFIGEKV